MGPMTASLGEPHAALLSDARTMRYERVALPPSVELVVADSGVAPGNAANGRRAPLNRRARHVVTENARVLEAVAALRAGDVDRVGELMAASHRSMRDDFDASVPAVDALVESAAAQLDTLGARLAGGGFGGAVAALVRAGAAERVAGAMLQEARRDRRAGVRVLVPSGVT